MFITVQHFLSHLKGKCVLIRSDNTSVVQYINRQGGTKSPNLCYLTWELWQLAIQNNIVLKSAHIMGKKNVLADQLSRVKVQPTEWSLDKSVVRQIFQVWGAPLIDLFASWENRQREIFCTWIPHSNALALDALTISWEKMYVYVFPPDLSHSEDIAIYEAVPVSNNSDCTAGAKEALVYRNTAVTDSMPNKTSSNTQSFDSVQNENLSPKSRNSKFDNLASFDKRFKTEGFSEPARKFLSASWREDTKRDYSAKLEKYNSWCRGQQIDPYSANLNQIADFLAYLYQSGLQYRTIAGYRSMLSAVLPPVQTIPVGKHPSVVRIIKGVFNSRPPKVKLLPEWSLELVLDALEKLPFEPMEI